MSFKKSEVVIAGKYLISRFYILILMASLSVCIMRKEFNNWLNVCYRKPEVMMDIQSISSFVFYRHDITERSLS